MTRAETEVIIVGGGVVGLSLAVSLGREGIPLSLVEANAFETGWPDDSVDMRVYAISRASERLFRDFGVWRAIEDLGASPFQGMHVWDAGGRGEIRFDCAELGQPWLGHIIEARVISKALLDALATMPSVTIHCPARIVEFDNTEGLQSVRLDDGTLLQGRLLAGADGIHSRVRDYAGIHARESDYGQKALVAVVSTEKPHQETAWQRFLATGPLAFLPLRDGRCSIVWSATSQEAERLAALDEADFCQALTDASEGKLGNIINSSERVLFPLRRQHAQCYVKPGIALLGDAAHVIHPLAGQGVNLGLSDVRELGNNIKDTLLSGRNPGAYAALRRYERARKGDNLLMMTAMDSFKQLFGVSALPVRWARNTGLDLVNASTPLKNSIMRYAMGL